MDEYVFEKYEVGDKVIHETFGVCVVKKIEQFISGNKKMDYYRLESCDAAKHIVYVPVEHHVMKLKKCQIDSK